MAEMDEGPPPMCLVCNHAHHQSKKCPVCGHKGKGKIHQLLAEGPVALGLNFRFFDQRSSERWFKGYWELARIIRRRVYCEELQVPQPEEFDDLEPSSRHVLIQVGDAPVGYGRWHFEGGPSGGGQFALVDRLCVLKDYRNQGYARQCVEEIVKDVSSRVSEMQVSVSAIVVPIPSSHFAHAKLAGNGFSQQGETFLYRGVPHVHMYLLPSQQSVPAS
ncbi:unnamed protein product [Discosporangium mesarthrocarpum]